MPRGQNGCREGGYGPGKSRLFSPADAPKNLVGPCRLLGRELRRRRPQIVDEQVVTDNVVNRLERRLKVQFGVGIAVQQRDVHRR